MPGMGIIGGRAYCTGAAAATAIWRQNTNVCERNCETVREAHRERATAAASLSMQPDHPHHCAHRKQSQHASHLTRHE